MVFFGGSAGGDGWMRPCERGRGRVVLMVSPSFYCGLTSVPLTFQVLPDYRFMRAYFCLYLYLSAKI